jgi:CHAT domain-containing protein
MNESREFRGSSEIWDIDWTKIQENIGDEDVVIEFVDFYTIPQKKKTEHMYASLLVNKECEYPIYIPLFTENDVLEILGDFNDIYSLNSNKIFELIWSKIIPYIKDSKNVYFSPSGILHQLPVEHLFVNSTNTMSDVYNMVRLSSTREIVTNKSKESYNSAVVYGGISYDLDNNEILVESKHYPGLKHRSLENDSINRGSAKFLPGTKEEAEKINKLLADNKIEAVIYKTKSANEESFKSLSGKHNNILHIATHGFTWTDSTARKQDYFADRMQMQLVGDNQMCGPIIDPLDRCGLLFAGANTALQGKSKELPDGVQDGILTAKEISLMDLRDSELVVLSACETAKGDITSEGVFGLQRAFKMAGAKTIIMSLWKVDDKATQLLMTEFYTNWITKKQPKREAFRHA